MTQEERQDILEWLDQLDREEAFESEGRSIDLFVEGKKRLNHTRAAYDEPDMTYDEFVALMRKHARKGKPGAPPADSATLAEEPMFRAAHDFDRIRAGRPEVDREDALEIAAHRHGVDEAKLDTLVRRRGRHRHDHRARRP